MPGMFKTTIDTKTLKFLREGTMASSDRFYMLELRHRPAVYGDLGHILKIQGLVVGGEGAQAILMLPNESIDYPAMRGAIHHLSTEEWTDFLIRTDSPEVLVMPAKAFHRKVRYEISGAVQQKVWLADGLKCMYCYAKMGDVQLTIDHFIPLEMGGVNNTSNFLSACRRCNKDKGSMDPRDWCQLKRIVKLSEAWTINDYDAFANYLRNRKLP